MLHNTKILKNTCQESFYKELFVQINTTIYRQNDLIDLLLDEMDKLTSKKRNMGTFIYKNLDTKNNSDQEVNNIFFIPKL